MDQDVAAILDVYHEQIRQEHTLPRQEAQVGVSGRQDRRMHAVGPDNGQLLKTLARSLRRPTILELGTSFGYSGVWLAEDARASGGGLLTMGLDGLRAGYGDEGRPRHMSSFGSAMPSG